jgi:hypothetical protein
MRSLKKLIIFIIAIFIGIWILQKLNIFPSTNPFKSKPVEIEETSLLIKEIKSIAQLITVVAYDEVVVDSTIVDKGSRILKFFNPLSPYPILPVVNKRIVLIGKGKVYAGTELKNLESGDITVDNDTVTLKLKPAIILDAIINPGDFETFDETGVWNDQAVTAVKLKARQKIIDRALQQNILQKADVKAKAVMTNFLLGSGYDHVKVVIE